MRVFLCLMLAAAVQAQDEEEPGHGLRTFPEFDRLLSQADELADKDRYDLAATLWQKVIDDSRDAVITRGGWLKRTEHGNEYRRFKPARSEVEKILAELPPRALAAYRLRADGEARALLAAADSEHREQALGQVATRYFLSSLGDDAAAELAALHLDRMEFLPALRMFARVLDVYPDADVDRDRLLAGHAVACARAGHGEVARELLKELRARSNLPAAVVAHVEKDCRDAGDGPARAMLSSTKGVSPAPPDSVRRGGMERAWTYWFPGEFDQGLGELRTAWEEFGWLPSGSIRRVGPRTLFMTDHQLDCLEPAEGTPDWRGMPHAFPADEASQVYFGWPGRPDGTFRQPIRPEEVAAFGDLLHPELTVDGGLVYALEGGDEDLPLPGARRGGRWGHGWNRPNEQAAKGRGRRNRLMAYDLETGKVVWWRWATENHEEPPAGNSVGFVGAPVPVGDTLLIPVLEEESLWLHALDTDPAGRLPLEEKGRTLWKTYLCADDQVSLSRFSSVDVAVSGGEVYVLTGTGCLMALNALSGALRWAVTHPRSVREKRDHRVYYDPFNRVGGWEQDTLIVGKKRVYAMASDFEQIFAVDREDGALLWETTPITGEHADTGRYCLGVANGGLFVAGRRVLRRYDLRGGLLQWEARTQQSYGRALLTEDLIFFPEEHRILMYETGTERVLRGRVSPPLEGDPVVGNLFSDGERLFIHGLRAVHAYK